MFARRRLKMDNITEEVLEKELERFSKNVVSFENQNAVSERKKPIGFDVVLNAHKLLAKSNIWSLLPRKGKYSESKLRN